MPFTILSIVSLSHPYLYKSLLYANNTQLIFFKNRRYRSSVLTNKMKNLHTSRIK